MIPRDKSLMALSALLGLLSCAALMIQPSFAITEQGAMAAYQQKNYTAALQAYKDLVIQHPGNMDYLFRLGVCCARLQQYDRAKEIFNLVLQNVPIQSELGQKANKNLSLMTQGMASLNGTSAHNASLVQKASALNQGSLPGDNYLSHALHKGYVFRWDLGQPIKYCILRPAGLKDWSPNLDSVFVQAMQSWRSALGGKLHFVEVSDKSKADIRFLWQNQLDDNKLGVSPFKVANGKIIQSDVVLALKDPRDGSPLTADQIASTAVHELGHALGIKGHSPYPEDIMYYQEVPGMGASLSPRDVRTINLLYKLDSDAAGKNQTKTAKKV
jgi:predicted Zn-dependent protease